MHPMVLNKFHHFCLLHLATNKVNTPKSGVLITGVEGLDSSHHNSSVASVLMLIDL